MSLYRIDAKPGKKGVRSTASLNSDCMTLGEMATAQRSQLKIFCLSDKCMKNAKANQIFILPRQGRARIISNAAQNTIDCPRCGHAAFSSRRYWEPEKGAKSADPTRKNLPDDETD